MRTGPSGPAVPSDRPLGYCPLTMRGLTSICLSLVLLGCGSDAPGRGDESSAPEQPRLRLEVGGAFVTLPNGTAPVEQALAQHILASYRLTGAADDPEVEIRRTPDGALVVLHHLTAPLVAHGGENVGTFLDELLAEQLAASGIAPDDPSVTPRQRNGAVQRCFSRATQASRSLVSCTSAYIDADGTEVVLDTVRCESEGAVATCRQVVDSFASDRAKLPLDRTLEATRSPGLPDVGPHGLAWIRLGATRAEFEDACRRSPGRIDTSESATAPPEVQRAMSAGRFVACAGGGATSLGPIELVHASFDAEDRLVQASLWVSASHAELSATLRRAYPDYLPEPALTSYFVNRQATDDALLGITCSPSTSRPGRTMLQITSRRGYDAPPF